MPWADPAKTYRVQGLFSAKSYGTIIGRQLQDTGIQLALLAYGQELLEIETASGSR